MNVLKTKMGFCGSGAKQEELGQYINALEGLDADAQRLGVHLDALKRQFDMAGIQAILQDIKADT